MKRAFTKNPSDRIRKILILTLVFVLLVSTFSGCFGKEKPEETDPQTPPGLLTDGSEPKETDPVDETEPTGTEPVEDVLVNIATVKEDQINIRTAPSSESTVIGQLVKGDQVEIVDEQTLMGMTWGKILEPQKGWIPMDLVDLPGGFVAPTEPEDPDETTPEGTEPEETKPEEEPGNNTTGDGSTKVQFRGIVTASQLNIRSKAGTDGDRVGSLVYGDRVEILEKSGNWGRTTKGWISLDYVYQDGTTGKNTAKGIVLADTLNIRSGPGTNYGQAGSYSYGNRVKILEQFTIGNSKWGCTDKGWISMDYLYIDGTAGENGGTGTITGNQLNIRSGPGTNYDRVGSLDSGDTVEIYTQLKIGDSIWGCIDKGWISMEYVDMD